MKKLKKLTAITLASVCLASFSACSLPFDLPFDLPFFNSNEPENQPPLVKAEKISSDLLDGKVANLMSASGLGIQKKTEPQLETAKATNAKLIVASAEDTNEQPITELVKAMGNKVQDVRFHNNDEGSYRWWNKQFDEHHHNGVLCEVENCAELSDEIVEMEESGQGSATILSMGARVNKLYNGGDFTFVCVSSAVEGEARVLSEFTNNPMGFDAYAYSGTTPTLLNLEFSEKGMAYNRIEFGSGDDKGIILVKRSESEKNYHQANYWSDNYNQSYVIDNETGITYSLAERFPYIYSVTGNVISVWKGGRSKIFDYYTVSVENEELQFTKLNLPEQNSPYFALLNQNPLVDIYGNVVFQRVGEIPRLANNLGVTLESGAVLSEELRYPDNPKVIFAGTNQQLFEISYREYGYLDPIRSPEYAEYQNSTRYFKGSDGKIYRFGYLASLNNIPVKVLDENGEWQEVPSTTSTQFSPQTGYMFAMSRAGLATQQTFFMVTEISNGYAYFSNATWGEEAGYVHGGCFTSQMEGTPVGVIKMPVAGGADSALIELTAKLASQNQQLVFRSGNTAIIYKDGTSLVLWDRKTDRKSVIQGVDDNLKIHDNSCFSINNLYIPFAGINFEWTLENFSTQPIKKEVKLEAFYSLLINKN